MAVRGGSQPREDKERLLGPSAEGGRASYQELMGDLGDETGPRTEDAEGDLRAWLPLLGLGLLGCVAAWSGRVELLGLLLALSLTLMISQAWTCSQLDEVPRLLQSGGAGLTDLERRLRLRPSLRFLLSELASSRRQAAAAERQLAEVRRQLERRVRERTHELAESERKFRQLVQAAPDVILKQDACGSYVFLNDAVERIIGYTPAQLYEWPNGLVDRVHEEDRQRVVDEMAVALAGREDVVGSRPFRLRCRDGSELWLEQTLYPWRHEDGRVRGIHGILRDVSRRVRAERDLSRAQDDLVASTRLASVGELAGSVAHEVLNPLTSVLSRCELLCSRNVAETTSSLQALGAVVDGWCQAHEERGLVGLVEELRREVPGQEGRLMVEDDLEALRTVHEHFGEHRRGDHSDFEFMLKNIHRIARIVDELRGMSRAVRSVERCHVEDPIRDAVALLEDGLEKRRIELRTVLPEGLPEVDIDCSEIVQVLTNLLRNAMQAVEEFQPTGDGAIEIEARLGGWRIEIRVRDNGPGVAVEHRGRLFRPDFTTKPAGQGTGLGLSISRRLARAQQGELDLEPEGQGACFVLSLPVPGASPMPDEGELPDTAGVSLGMLDVAALELEPEPVGAET
ncbi:MAG: ATP-binding protein [Acidobacteriota bacterium]